VHLRILSVWCTSSNLVNIKAKMPDLVRIFVLDWRLLTTWISHSSISGHWTESQCLSTSSRQVHTWLHPSCRHARQRPEMDHADPSGSLPDRRRPMRMCPSAIRLPFCSHRCFIAWRPLCEDHVDIMTTCQAADLRTAGAWWWLSFQKRALSQLRISGWCNTSGKRWQRRVSDIVNTSQVECYPTSKSRILELRNPDPLHMRLSTFSAPISAWVSKFKPRLLPHCLHAPYLA